MLSLQLFAPAIALPRAAVHSRSPPVRMVTSLEPPPTAMRKPLTEPYAAQLGAIALYAIL